MEKRWPVPSLVGGTGAGEVARWTDLVVESGMLRLRLQVLNELPPFENQNAAAAKSLQACPTLCNPIDCSLPGSSVQGIFQARVLAWVAIAFCENLNISY